MLKVIVSKRLFWVMLAIIIFTTVSALNSSHAVASTQASYYVSSAGSDSNDGTSANTPFATITKARDVVRSINGSMTGDIYVYLMNGIRTVDGLNFGPSGCVRR